MYWVSNEEAVVLADGAGMEWLRSEEGAVVQA